MRVLVFLLLMFLAAPALACECEFYQEQDYIYHADAIFIGSLSKEPEFAHSALWSSFIVNETLKVNDSAKKYFSDKAQSGLIEVLVIQDYNNCSYLFEVDKTYKVYAVLERTSDDRAYLSTSICTGTTAIE